MRLSHLSFLLSAFCVSLSHAAPIALTGPGPYTQNFDTLLTTATTPWLDDSTLPGWYAKKVATTALNLVAGDGASNSGNLYSFGVGTETERALGSVGSGTPQTFTYGVQFENTSAGPVSIGSIAYTGEQWRNGGNAATQPLTFWYRISDTLITDLTPADDSTWTAATTGNFVSPVVGATPATLVGNDPANRTAISFNLGIAVPAGKFLMLRWKDINDAGNDHGLAVDDLSVSYAAATGGTIALSFGPDNALETAGTSATTGTITLSSAAPAGGLAVALTSNDADSSEITLPASVNVAEGQTTATFSVGTKTDGVFDGPQAISILAAATNFAPGSATFTVTDSDASPSLVITEIFDAQGPGSTAYDMNGNGVSGFDDAYLEITNTGTTTADLSGYLIKTNGSGTPGVRHTFPAGTTLAPGAIYLLFQGVSAATPPNPAFTGFATVAGSTTNFLIMGDSADDITLTTASGTVISSFAYTSGSPGTALVRDTDNSIITHALATTAADLPFSPGRRTNGTASPTVTQSGFFLFPTTPTDIYEKNDVASGFPNTATFTAYRVGPDATAPVTVNLASSDPANATVPANVTILATQNRATFTVTGVTDNAQDPASVKVGNIWVTPVTITGTLGAGTFTGKVNVIDAERFGLLIPSIFANLTTIAEGDPVGTTLSVGIPAAEAADKVFTVTATVNGSQVTLANGGLVTITAGNTAADIGVVAVDDADTDGPKIVTFVTSATGYEPATTTLTVTDNDILGYIPLSGTGTYTQDFNALPSTGTSGTWLDDNSIAGWYAQRTGTGTSILVDAGGGNSGGLYSYGVAAAADRALGSLGSSNVAAGHFAYGIQFKNTTASLMTLGTLSYVGEQWRNGGSAAQKATLWYKIATTSTTALTPNVDTDWIALTAGDFTSPVTLGTAGPLDGNATGNRTAISFSTGLSLAAGELIMFRWSDVDQTGSDHGLSLDDFSLTYTAGAPATGYAAWATGLFGANASNPAIAGINADPDGDGVVNLLEYALGTSPLLVNEARRVTSTQTPTGYTLSYTAPTVPPTEVSYILEAAPSPTGTWVPLTSGFVPSLVNNGNGTSTVTLTRPFTGTQEFLRLRISIP